MYTHCPNCDTHFEISQEYLDIANGKVRCGQCNHIFNALDNLYEKQATTPKDLITPVADSRESIQTSIISTEQTSADKSQFHLSSPSIDIKEKMERIAASLSAATAELKNARKATHFYSSGEKTKQVNIPEAEQLTGATKEYTPEQPVETTEIIEPALPDETTNNIEPELPEEIIDIIDPVPPVETVEIIATEPDNTIDNIEAELPEEITDIIDPVLPVETVEIIATEPDNTIDNIEAELPEEITGIIDPILPVETVEIIATEPDNTIDNIEPELPEEITDIIDPVLPAETVEIVATEPDNTIDNIEPELPEEIEDELDLVTFNESEPDDSLSSSKEPHSPQNYDKDDIDILNSLMDDQDNTPSQNSLLNELDDINQTLSDSNDSLDDEFSKPGSDFDDLDNGDDLLAELEQLESDFLNKDISSIKGMSPAYSDAQSNGSLAADGSLSADGTLPADGSSLANGSTSEDIFATGAETKDASSAKVQEEVVPSFLTQTESSHTSPAAMLGWLSGTIILLLVLAAQYLHVNSIKFSQDRSFRPLLETLCPITNCALPLLSQPGKIVTVSHDVRSHPGVNNALEIHLTFKNKAPHTQNYPILEITFSNPLGEVVAQRKFIPDEYLSGDIQYSRGLKTNQTQEVNLKIVDPNPDSELSFQFNYL